MESFLLQNPFLVELKPFHFAGLYNELYKLDLHFPQFPNIKDRRVAIFRGEIEIHLCSDLSKFDKVDAFVRALCNTLDQLLSSGNSIFNTSTDEEIANMTNVAFQVLSIQEQYGLNVAFDNKLISVEINGFENGDIHFLALQRIENVQFKVFKHTLPELSVAETFKRHTTIQRQVQVFIDTLGLLAEFYHNLNTIDQLCYVVLPTHINTKTTYRVFKYNQKVFFKISLHPLQPAAVNISFIGPTNLVAKLREIYDEKQGEWDLECNIYTNLLRIFDIIAFPMRPIEQAETSTDNDASCGICMAYLDDESRIPIISCDNDKCLLIFHIICLKEWFSTQRESKKFFTISIGYCPYCKHKISSSFDDIISFLA